MRHTLSRSKVIRRKTSEANISWYSYEYIAIEPQPSVLHTKPSADINNAMRAQKEREYDYDYDYDYDDYDRGPGGKTSMCVHVSKEPLAQLPSQKENTLRIARLAS